MNHFLDTRTVVLLLLPVCTLLAAFFAWPLALVGWNSFYDAASGAVTLQAYSSLSTSTLFYRVLANTLQISSLATSVSLVLGYVIALHLARMDARRRAPYMVMVMLPFWTSILVKSFAFTVVLGDQGLVNQFLGWLAARIWDGTLHLDMLFNRAGVIIGMTNYLLPFMVFPIMASLLAQNESLPRVAEIMGAGPVRIFLRITLPLSLPGVLAGVLMNMTLAMGMYITPALLGGRRDMMMANLVDFYTRQTLDWNLASAIAIVLLALSGPFIAALMRVQRNEAIIR
jgi:putative spermidine/putrescine transport system permease protein